MKFNRGNEIHEIKETQIIVGQLTTIQKLKNKKGIKKAAKSSCNNVDSEVKSLLYLQQRYNDVNESCWNPQTSKRPKKHGTSARYIKLVQTVSLKKRRARYLNSIQQARPEQLKVKDHYTS